MQITDLVHQYYNNVSSGSTVSNGTEGIHQVSSTLSQLQEGQVFEGSVVSKDGEKVVISLDNGQNVSARLQGNISLSEGSSVFFQVKSNSGGSIELTPIPNQLSNNPTILNALDAAGLPASDKNLVMVDSMMKNSMSIDSNALMSMARQIARNPETDVSILVDMNRLRIPTTPEMVSQYENYLANQNAVLDSLSELSTNITESISNGSLNAEDALNLQTEIFQLMTGENAGENSPAVGDTSGQLAQTPDELTDQTGKTVSQELTGQVKEIVSQEPTGQAREIVIQEPTGQARETVNQELTGQVALTHDSELAGQLTEEVTGQISEEVSGQSTGEIKGESREVIVREAPETVSYALKDSGLSGLERELKALPDFEKMHSSYFDADGKLRPDTDAKELARDILQYLKENPDALKKNADLLTGKSFSALMKNVYEQSFTVKPEELMGKEHPMKELYKNMTVRLNEVDQLLQKTIGEDNPASRTIHNVQDNVKFMDTLNQNYTYLQIPLRMSGQNATGQLYVYHNKRKGKSVENEELTAFLHFDMEHLGSTDIAVKLKNKKVDTRFYMDNDASYDLIRENLPILEARLNAKGYTCKLEVSNDKHPVNFITEIVEKDAPKAGTLQKYSFDVKA
ncbi:MAG: flagellar hook-length control protein FliK [Lachnospiraceae bacterium]|nr:flagellar hook-length control protein FliK [Lachnospiraceae bacterium]